MRFCVKSPAKLYRCSTVRHPCPKLALYPILAANNESSEGENIERDEAVPSSRFFTAC